MNKHHYKVIFSRVLNQLVVVSELAKSAGKAAVDSVETHFSSNSNKINELHCIFRETFKIEGAFEKARTAKAARIED